MPLLFACATDVGRVRPNNEDAVLIDPELGLAVLADGMGGYQAGEIASRLCCRVVHEQVQHALVNTPLGEEEALLRAAIQAANARIYTDALLQPSHRGMATTVVVALARAGRLAFAYVGDSRLYRLRQGQLVQLSHDHTLVQEHVDAGLLPAAEARLSRYRNLVTRAVGIDLTLLPDSATQLLQPGDTYLLCSDGLHDMLSDGEITHLLCHQAGPSQVADALVAAANAAGGRDNIAVALIHCAP
ncbi:PP2C family protein-serine/threonine phosphatase [Tepidimonas charontis]|uniref:PPM-type phosphatase domain-containing protein n=1 Tax=Tepidimonas charontis TaxID=2267262 RepID=A0A554XCV8_9BURK|nr:protein phosphatase 2C domain-containing protein [Tepidimonas charontis]TSE33670.1 putative protein phosphatase 2C-type [Tepidimonas charontis]